MRQIHWRHNRSITNNDTTAKLESTSSEATEVNLPAAAGGELHSVLNTPKLTMVATVLSNFPTCIIHNQWQKKII